MSSECKARRGVQNVTLNFYFETTKTNGCWGSTLENLKLLLSNSNMINVCLDESLRIKQKLWNWGLIRESVKLNMCSTCVTSVTSPEEFFTLWKTAHSNFLTVKLILNGSAEGGSSSALMTRQKAPDPPPGVQRDKWSRGKPEERDWSDWQNKHGERLKSIDHVVVLRLWSDQTKMFWWFLVPSSVSCVSTLNILFNVCSYFRLFQLFITIYPKVLLIQDITYITLFNFNIFLYIKKSCWNKWRN